MEMNYPGDEPSKAAQKALEVVDKIISPVTTFLQGKADASQIRSVAQAESDAAAIKVRAQMRIEGEYVRHQRNLENIADKAKRQLLSEPKTEEVSGEARPREIDEDWLSKFSDFARHSSDDDIQKLWAKILSGELQQPGSYSVRLMYTLHSLTKTDAGYFQLAANYIWIADGIGYAHLHTPETDAYLANAKNMGWGFWAHLDALGLIQNTPFVGLLIKVGETAKLHYGGNEWAIRAHGRDEKISTRVLTRLGIELYSLCTAVHDPEYQRIFADYLRRNSTSFHCRG